MWGFEPLRRVGPLSFGMALDEVCAALAGDFGDRGGIGVEDGTTVVCFDRSVGGGTALTAYVDASAGLAGVAVNASHGPQVSLGGVRLVGRVLSELEREVGDFCGRRDEAVGFTMHADLYVPGLGVVCRPQRSGDVVLSRAVLVSEAWMDDLQGPEDWPIPEREWRTFVEW